MQILNDYFAGVVFQYIEEKQSYAVYAAAIYGLVGGNLQRYVFAFVPAHLGIQDRAKLSALPWKNLQTRMCPQGVYKLKEQSWKPKSDVNVTFSVKKRETGYSTYNFDINKSEQGISFPFELVMINSPKVKSIYQYPDIMNIHFAIDKFQTIFNYIGDIHPILIEPIHIHNNIQNNHNNNNIQNNNNIPHPLQSWIDNTTMLENDNIEFL